MVSHLNAGCQKWSITKSYSVVSSFLGECFLEQSLSVLLLCSRGGKCIEKYILKKYIHTLSLKKLQNSSILVNKFISRNPCLMKQKTRQKSVFVTRPAVTE